MRYKVKTKDCRLYVRAKASFGENIDEKALDIFARTYIRGFLKAKLIKKNNVEYSGPIGISLHERLKKPMTKRDFLLIMEQLVLAVQKAEANRLQLSHIVFDLQNVFINDKTKEIQFLYVPMTKECNQGTVMEFIESVVYSLAPMDDKDPDFVSRFILFIKAQETFIPEVVEKYIAKEDRSVVNTIKKQNAGQSGFMTSKQAHYYEHYEKQEEDSSDQKQETQNKENPEKVAQSVSEKTEHTTIKKVSIKQSEKASAATEEEATGVLCEEETGVLEEEATGVLCEEETGVLEEEATGVLCEEETGVLEEEATGVLCEEETGVLEEEATGVLCEEETGVLEEEATGVLCEEETSLLVEEKPTIQAKKQQVVFPVLYRVLTNETIKVDKPVFRLGKERSYVDYFVSNNNAVSRSHADIITRGSEYFVRDLNSKNHTYINDNMISVQYDTKINDGDRLKLGNEEFIFRVAQPKAEKKIPEAKQAAFKKSFCHHCGNKVEHEGKFCIYCGSRLIT